VTRPPAATGGRAGASDVIAVQVEPTGAAPFDVVTLPFGLVAELHRRPRALPFYGVDYPVVDPVEDNFDDPLAGGGVDA